MGLNLDKYFTDEEKAKIAEVDAERAARAEARNEAAAKAFHAAVNAAGGDRHKLVVHSMPDKLGGAVIHKLPTPETLKAIKKKITKALISDGKKDNTDAAIAALIMESTLLVHPDISELQQWENELPDLFSEVHNTLDARCSHGQSAGK